MKWKMRNAAPDTIGALQNRYGLDLISAKILAGREITKPDDVKFYLENDISFLNNPFLFDDMEIFCERVLQAMENSEKVHIFGDRDVDGITSTALLTEELTRMGIETTYSVPMGDEPYAFTKETIDGIIEQGVTLAITVDCGISCFEEIDYAQSKGLDFLVTDHHIADKVIPPARAVINPKVEGSSYPFRDLAGVGVVAKCIWALRFAQTDFYNQEILLLHSIPGNGTVITEAVKLENLIVKQRVSEETVPGVLKAEDSRLMRFLDCSLPVFVLDSEDEENQLKKAFPKVDIHLTDLREQFEKYLPSIKGKSLFALSSVSRFALYSDTKSELDTLIGLFSAYVRSSNPSIYREYLKITDLVAIGTISDLMPMTNENRIIVKNGLKMLCSSSRLSMIPFMSLQNLLKRKLTATDVSWQISPFMNAAGRMGCPDVAIKMLLSEEQDKTFEYAQELIRLNKDRQKLGEDCWDRLLPSAKKSYEEFGSKLVMVRDDKIPRGITGIFATRLQKAFKAPVMVITRTQDGRAVGSVRSPKNFNCHDFLSRYSYLLDDFGGHDCAGGFTLSPEKTDELMARISEDIDYLDFPDSPGEEELIIDTSVPEEFFTEKIMQTVEVFEPYGEFNPPVTFKIEGAKIENITAMNNSKDPSSNHIKMNLCYGAYRWPAVFWSAGARVGKDFNEGDTVNVVFRLGYNYYKNQESIQITIADIQRSGIL